MNQWKKISDAIDAYAWKVEAARNPEVKTKIKNIY